MTRPRVLIAESNLLLGASIERLLAHEAHHMEVIGIMPGSEATLIREIRYAQPDVVILNEASRLTDSMKLLGHLQDYPKLRVVVISADHNSLQIYDKQQIMATQRHDLASLILNPRRPA